ncbi:nuclear transport factor 2 family protein [Flavobacterium sp. LaA7.5]|nr:nuclear transport factor 2 family protein [Flavobacterium salilacus subsp. altitudinum]
MNLPKVIADLVKAQENRDSAAFVDCFTETARVFDEEKTHTGKEEIKAWMEKTTGEYNMVMNPIGFEGDKEAGVFITEVSGTFPGSPIVFKYNLEFDGDFIRSLEITT